MGKIKKVFLCESCGADFPKWMGQCPSCEGWSTIQEKRIDTVYAAKGPSELVSLKDISPLPVSRISLGVEDIDRVFGGGLVPGSVLLLGGEPGVGKSTFLLQLAARVAKAGAVIYLSGEESLSQIKMRSVRLGLDQASFLIAHETNLEAGLAALAGQKPLLVIVDSIQTVQSESILAPAGTISQVRFCAQKWIDQAKQLGACVIFVGHITKDGNLAGPKALEHMVDGVFLFEGERSGDLRVLRAQKNRFGPGGEMGLLKMQEKGLHTIADPSKVLLAQRPENVSGSVVVPCMQGQRVFLVEIQVLLSTTAFAAPRRLAMGMDPNRLSLILAILEKKAGLQIQGMDVYANLVGGLQIREPALDLGLALAIYSAFRNIPLDPRLGVFGEVGLSGDVRSVPKRDLRLAEMKRFGFEKTIGPKVDRTLAGYVPVGSIVEALEQAL